MEIGASVWVRDGDQSWVSSTVISKVSTICSSLSAYNLGLVLINIMVLLYRTRMVALLRSSCLIRAVKGENSHAGNDESQHSLSYCCDFLTSIALILYNLHFTDWIKGMDLVGSSMMLSFKMIKVKPMWRI